MSSIKAYGLDHSGAHICTLKLLEKRVASFDPDIAMLTFNVEQLGGPYACVTELAVMHGVDLMIYYPETYLPSDVLLEQGVSIWLDMD